MQRSELTRGPIIFIGISALAFLLDILLEGRLLVWGAKSQAIWAGEWYRLIVANFIHSGVPHLLFNMYALYVFGRIVEELAGRGGFMAVYLIGGVTGFLTSLLARPDSLSVGASAAVFALMGYTLHFRLRRLPLRWLPIDSAFLQILGLNVIMGLSVPNIDQFAHLGGFVGGFFAAGVLGLPHSPYLVNQTETPPAERIFAAAAILLFLWGGLSPLSFGAVVGQGAPDLKAAIETRYERYFASYLLVDAAVLWLDPNDASGWTLVDERVRRPPQSPFAVAAFWRWVRGGGDGEPAAYKVTWQRMDAQGWETVQVDQGHARRPDPGPGRIFRRSMVAVEQAQQLVGDWRLIVEVDGKVQYTKAFSVVSTQTI